MPTESDMPRHQAYVLRFWETRSLPPDPASQWRYSLENLRGPGEHKFADLESLMAFLGEAVAKPEGRGRNGEPGANGEAEAKAKEKATEVTLAFDPAETSILLVEEAEAIRQSVDRWLRETLPEATVVGAGDDESAVRLARSQSPDAILIDVAPPKTNGEETVRRLRAAAPAAQIVALTMEGPKARLDAVVDAGASACVKIWEIRQRLLPALNQLLDRERKDVTEAKTVVCIEDEIDMLSLIKYTLERHNINLVTALDGREGLDAVQRTKPDLVLLDLMMPNVNGWEVFQRLRQNAETRDIPVIVLTVMDPRRAETRGIDMAGVTDYVRKPFVPKDLVSRVGRALDIVA